MSAANPPVLIPGGLLRAEWSALGLAAQRACVWGEGELGEGGEGTKGCLPMGTY